MSTPLTLYTRAGCHLCTAMQVALEAGFAGRDIDVHIIDVDTSPELSERYGLMVPVLVGEDGTICYGRLDEDALEDYLGGG